MSRVRIPSLLPGGMGFTMDAFRGEGAPINPRRRGGTPPPPQYDEWGELVDAEEDYGEEEYGEDEYGEEEAMMAEEGEEEAEYEEEVYGEEGEEAYASEDVVEAGEALEDAGAAAAADEVPEVDEEAREAAEAGLAILESLRAALHTNHARVIDLFRSWDKNNDGTVRSRHLDTHHPPLHYLHTRSAR